MNSKVQRFKKYTRFEEVNKNYTWIQTFGKPRIINYEVKFICTNYLFRAVAILWIMSIFC